MRVRLGRACCTDNSQVTKVTEALPTWRRQWSSCKGCKMGFREAPRSERAMRSYQARLPTSGQGVLVRQAREDVRGARQDEHGHEDPAAGAPEALQRIVDRHKLRRPVDVRHGVACGSRSSEHREQSTELRAVAAVFPCAGLQNCAASIGTNCAVLVRFVTGMPADVSKLTS